MFFCEYIFGMMQKAAGRDTPAAKVIKEKERATRG